MTCFLDYTLILADHKHEKHEQQLKINGLEWQVLYTSSYSIVWSESIITRTAFALQSRQWKQDIFQLLPKLMNSVEKRVLFYYIRLLLKEAETLDYKELTQSCLFVGRKTAEYCTIPTFSLPLKSHHRAQKPSGCRNSSTQLNLKFNSGPPTACRPRSSLSAQSLAELSCR